MASLLPFPAPGTWELILSDGQHLRIYSPNCAAAKSLPTGAGGQPSCEDGCEAGKPHQPQPRPPGTGEGFVDPQHLCVRAAIGEQPP